MSYQPIYSIIRLDDVAMKFLYSNGSQLNLSEYEFINIRGGTWALVFKGATSKSNKKDIIIKQYGDVSLDNSNQEFPKPVARSIVNEYLSLRKLIIENGIKVPEIYNIGLDGKSLDLNNLIVTLANNDYANKNESLKLIVLEQYVGKSIRQLIRQNLDNKTLKNHLDMARDLILKIPEDIEVDTNPGNITVDEKGDLFFIDFMPPKIWSHKNKKMDETLRKLFPIKRINDSKIKWYYYKTEGRIKRFNDYVVTLLSKTGLSHNN